MVPLEDFLNSVKGMSQANFIKNFSSPFLVTSKKYLLGLKNGEKKIPSLHSASFATVVSDWKSQTMEREWMKFAWIFPVKSKKGGEMQMVNLGRTSNNDIVIDLAVISKFHCCFFIYSSHDISIVDGGSTNKTYVNNSLLESHQKQAVQSGDLIGFGSDVEFEFYYAKDLWEKISELSLYLA